MTKPPENTVLDKLPPHQAESGCVTQRELLLAERWVDAVCSREDDAPDEWLDAWLSAALPFSFCYGGQDGADLADQWQVEVKDGPADGDEFRRELVWTDEVTGLRLTCELKRFTAFPAVEWVLTFENLGADDTLIIENIQALDLGLRHSQEGQPYTVHGLAGGRSLPDDMVPFSQQLPSGARQKEMALGGAHPSSNRHLPFFNLASPEGRGVLVGVGWSGNWSAAIGVEDTELRARAGLKEARFVLRPGERVRMPRILLLFWEGRRLHGHNMLRQLLHRHYVPRLRGEGQKPLVSVNVCFTHHGLGGFLHQATETEVLSLVDPFVELGTELFIIDAGWYDGEPWHEWQGNWRYSESKYPRGFRPIAEPLAEASVDFGVWFANESVNKSAPILEEHPEWVRSRGPGQGGTLRMELPEAREWFLGQVEELIEKEGMTCFRQDGSGHYGEEPEDRKGLTEIQHLSGLYCLWDTLIETHPDLVMEGCCGGGRRIDLETLSRFHWHQKSDRWYDTESDQCSLYGANLYLPGGLMNIPTEAIDDYGAWSSFAGQLCLGWHPLDDDFPIDLAKLQVERYKRIRPYLSGDFYPLTPCSLGEPWLGYQFHRRDLNAGFALLFRRSTARDADYPVSDTFRMRLRGLEPEMEYQAQLEAAGREEKHTGAALAKGLEIRISTVPGAEMILYRG